MELYKCNRCGCGFQGHAGYAMHSICNMCAVDLGCEAWGKIRALYDNLGPNFSSGYIAGLEPGRGTKEFDDWSRAEALSGVRVHHVPHNMMGVMAPIPYQSGDLVNYGGLIYRPYGNVSGCIDAARIGMTCISGDPLHECQLAWVPQCGYHHAEIWNGLGGPMFYCS